MTELKKDTPVPNPDTSVPKKEAPQERRVVLPEGKATPEQVKTAVDTYKKAKAQFDKSRKDRERKQQELTEKKSDSGSAEADVDAEPPFDTPTTYEVKSDIPGAPNITYNLLPGQKAPDNAVKVNKPKKSSDSAKSPEEIELDKKKQEEEKAVMESLRLKHTEEIDKTLKEFDFSQLTDEEKKMIHANSLSRGVDTTKITKEDKEAALSSLGLTGKVDINHLTPEQLQMVQQHKAKEYLKVLADFKNVPPEELEKKHPGIQDFMKNASQIYPVGENSAFVDQNGVFDQQKFFEQVKKDPTILSETIKSIKEDGFLLSGISADSQLGKALSQIISDNVDEYLDISKPNKDLVDLEHFKKLKDILGGSYTDLLFSEKFLLGDNHELKNTRDVLMQLLEDEVSQMPLPKPGDTVAAQEYQQAIESAISSNTGVSNSVAKKVTGQISRGNLSPFVRFLADLFAPIGALMGGEVGDFWRRYLHETGMAKGDASGYPGENGTVSSAPHQGNYIENAHGSDIIGAAQKYVGVSESKNGDLISQMHQSGGLNAGPGTAWCMSFVQHVLRKDMGYTDAQIGTGKTAWAADGRKMGKHVAKEDVMPGDIALVNGAGSSGYHIGFVAWVDKAKGTYGLLGGNQGNAVTIREEKISSAREFRGFEQRQESSSPNPQLSSAQEAIASTDITKKALEWQKKGDIHGAVHCTDWVDKIFQEVTGKRVYDAPIYYNGVKKISGGTGIGGNHASKEQIANIREGQHLIVDHGNNGGKTHSVITLGTPDSAGRVQVVSYPNYGKPPKIETYTLGENTGAGEKRVLRIQGVGGGSSSRSTNVASGSTPNAPSDSVGSESDVDSLINSIKQNESGNSGPEGYATWNSGESFPSMGFAHFIWGTNTGHGNSFHDMINYITQNKGISIPEELNFLKDPNPPRNWNGLSSMQSDPKYSAITNFLSRNDVKRAGFDFIKTQRLDSMRGQLAGTNLAKFNLIAQGPKGSYILMDYINFKGEGLGNSGYGLKHVLEAMPMPSDSRDAAVKFRDTASRLLAARPDSGRWIAGWNNRLNTYI